ncbi:MAG: transposase [Bacteroidales bacterium]|nr:transposase [Bacteroidales bacterium]
MENDPFFDINDTSHLIWSTKLPHWHQDGKYVFVTFRLGDSLPQVLLDEYRADKETWIKTHPKPWTPVQEKEYYDKYVKVVDKWLDSNYGSCLLREESNRKIVENALHYYDGKKYDLLAFVVMPNHVHVLLQLFADENIVTIFRSIKSFSAKLINKQEHTTGRVWQSESYDRLIRDVDHLKHVFRYIYLNNPRLAWIKAL